VCAIILTAAIAISLTGLTAQETVHGGHLTDAEATLYATVLGAAVGAVAAYLAGHNR